MNTEKPMMPDYLFEVSWEVCNKVGGIHTVLATKSLNLAKDFKDRHILIGPDVWMDTEQNPDFIPDPMLFRSWKNAAADEGLRIRVGRWNIPGQPVAVLVDYTQFIARKNEILTGFWTSFGLDSISGQWDFIEPALFGYAAGKVIESFVRFNLQSYNKAVAHFHEWMSGGGLLYLKGLHLPLATVFTTHATVVGRCLACNNFPLYDSLNVVSADEKAREFNVTAKHSMEKCAAANADVFTTVSEITSVECERFLGRKPDLITPNGFIQSLVPDAGRLDAVRKECRELLLRTATAMTGKSYADPFLVGIGGRYEYKNKGIDVFLDTMARLNGNPEGRQILAFILVPAGNNGPDRELAARLAGQENGHLTRTTHILSEPEVDPVLNRMQALGLDNAPGDRVHVLFVPSYLNGNDGILDRPYYDLLSALDLTLFPSYYEPWGYTPLESLAFHVPTVTTSLAGFGLWVRAYYLREHPSIAVVDRNDSNYAEVVDEVVRHTENLAAAAPGELEKIRENAVDVASIARWRNHIVYYKNAYAQAIRRVVDEHGAFPEYRDEHPVSYRRLEVGRPSWGQVLVTRQLPDRLKRLDDLSRNLWWCWNQEAIDLFRSIDAELWDTVSQNPIALLDHISYKKYKELERDEAFLARLDRVSDAFSAYMEGKKQRKGTSVAYFCMEYGLDTSLKIYSGGLGILAGDYLKESSDMQVNLTAFGLLYRYGYFTQKLTGQGDQVADYDAQDFMKIPAVPVRDREKKWVTVSVAFPGRNIYARLWRVDVGRTELYLLDTDFEDNLPEDRQVTHHLYGGDWENRLKQELVLGIGGIRAMRALGLKADVYHCNEGHAAFIGLERLREYIAQEGFSFAEALELVRASSLFTTHTPVPAGHDAFGEDMLRTYIAHYPTRLKIDWQTLMALGKLNADDPNEKFSMSYLASNLSQEVNGVSWLHGSVSREILSGLWPGYLPEELHVGYVTNGVHYPTWTAPEWKEVHARVFGEKFASHHYDKECFREIYRVADEEIWAVRSRLRSRLIEAVRERLADPSATNHYAPHDIVRIRETLRDDVLTIGFARRFATYKRAHLLFRDLDALDRIVNDPRHPVQFLFAGKAHPADKAGQDLIRRIVEISKMPQFIGRIVFVPNYDINLAKLLVQGVDVWMNMPTRPLEASGTSGEKAAMNGVMHFSVLDGWWVEGYKPGAGWALPMERTYDDQNYQDELDAATVYNILENEIAPAFYSRNSAGLPAEWIGFIKNTVAQVACNFTTNRMMTDYLDKYYNPLCRRFRSLYRNDAKLAREIAFWKKKLRREWAHIEVLSFHKPDSASGQQQLGKAFHSEIRLLVGDIDPQDIGVELLYAQQDRRGKYHVKEQFSYRLESVENGVAVYRCSIVPDTTGIYLVAGRMFAKNNHLPHRQDLELVKWL